MVVVGSNGCSCCLQILHQFLELSRALLEGERGSTADDTDADGVYLGWFPGGKAATADAAMATHLLGVLNFGMAASLHFGMDTSAPPEVGVEVRHLYSWFHHVWGAWWGVLWRLQLHNC